MSGAGSGCRSGHSEFGEVEEGWEEFAVWNGL